jgi:Reverse transcriptase (RNA-dependent DNA polymerase)
VPQGSVLSPVLFAILVNDVIVACNASKFGYILMYADDILLCAAAVCWLQRLVNIVFCELRLIGLQLNAKKSSCK